MLFLNHMHMAHCLLQGYRGHAPRMHCAFLNHMHDVDEAQEEAVAWKGLAEMHKRGLRHLREDAFALHVEWELFGEIGACFINVYIGGIGGLSNILLNIHAFVDQSLPKQNMFIFMFE